MKYAGRVVAIHPTRITKPIYTLCYFFNYLTMIFLPFAM